MKRGQRGQSPARRRGLRVSVVEGSLHAVMMGVCESYLGALAVELGHRDLALALLITVPLLAGALSQLLSGFLVAALGTRRLVVLGASAQAVCHLGLAALALADDRRLWPFLLIKTAFWISGAVITPPWSAWMARLTEGIDRPRYFARRSATLSVALLGAFLAAGAVLEVSRRAGWVLTAFAGLFAVGLLARAASATLLAVQHDLPSAPARVTPAARIGRAARTSHWRVPIFIALVMFGAQVAVPFFTPFMLRELRLDYVTFAGLLAVSILAKAVAYPLFGRLATNVGLRRMLLLAGVGVALVPFIWALASSLAHLVLVQILGGVTWACFEFASFQLLIVSANEDCRVEFFALAGSGSGLAQLGGSMIGSHLLGASSLDYRGVFALSSVLRALPLVLLVSPWLSALAARTPFGRVFARIVTVRPEAGAVRTPILGAADVDEEP